MELFARLIRVSGAMLRAEWLSSPLLSWQAFRGVKNHLSRQFPAIGRGSYSWIRRIRGRSGNPVMLSVH
jgi:hypothetical protein